MESVGGKRDFRDRFGESSLNYVIINWWWSCKSKSSGGAITVIDVIAADSSFVEKLRIKGILILLRNLVLFFSII